MTYIQEDIRLEPVYSDVVETASRSFAAVRSSFFNWWRNPRMATWDDYWKYCLWQFAPTNAGMGPALVWTSPTRFATEDDMFSFMEANLPSSGGSYTSGTAFQLKEEVNNRDSYPEILRHRNSLVASMAGKHRWQDKDTNYYGVANAFNSAYYTNFNNELGQRLVEAATSFLPGTNNDNCVWYPRASRTLWNWPIPGGSAVNVTFAGSRGAAWDSVGSTWVTPAPVGGYSIGNPFLLYENKRNKVLATYTQADTERRMYELDSVAAQVFPCVYMSRYYGFLVKPHGGDSWATEAMDTAQYDVLLKLRYRGSYSNQYFTIQPWPTVAVNNEQLMWSHFSPTGTGSLLFRRQLTQLISNVDNNTIPSKVYLCRRHKATGRRSRWVPLYDIKRRLRNATFRVLPAR